MQQQDDETTWRNIALIITVFSILISPCCYCIDEYVEGGMLSHLHGKKCLQGEILREIFFLYLSKWHFSAHEQMKIP
jgi:hypothetical protein